MSGLLVAVCMLMQVDAQTGVDFPYLTSLDAYSEAAAEPEFVAAFNQSVRLWKDTKFKEALVSWQKTSDLADNTFGKSHDVALQCNVWCERCQTASKWEFGGIVAYGNLRSRTDLSDDAGFPNGILMFEKRISVHLRRIDVAKDLFGEESCDYAAELLNACVVESLSGNYELASQRAAQAVTILSRCLGAGDASRTFALHIDSTVNAQRGAYTRSAESSLKIILANQRSRKKKLNKRLTELRQINFQQLALCLVWLQCPELATQFLSDFWKDREVNLPQTLDMRHKYCSNSALICSQTGSWAAVNRWLELARRNPATAGSGDAFVSHAIGGKAAIAEGDFIKAGYKYHTAVDVLGLQETLPEELIPMRLRLAEVYHRQGIDALFQKHFDSADKLLKRYIESHWRHSYAKYLPELIRTLRVCGRVAEAVKRAHSFVEDTPETAISCSSNANIHIELARCHVALGDAKAAMVSQRKAIGIIESISGPQTLLLIPPLREYETMLEKSGASKDLQEVQTRLQSLGSQREQFVARCRRVLAAGPRPAENSHND